MKKVKIGIIGIGGMGGHHARSLVGGLVPEGELVAVCDISPARLEWARNELGENIKLFDRAEKLFAAKCCDAIVIATPHYFHPPLAIDGLNAGYHVLIEKPAGVYTKQVREMNEAASLAFTEKGLIFGIMYNQRTRPVYQKLKDMVESGEIGELKRTNWLITSWYRSQSYFDSGGWRATWEGEGGGVLLNQCPHQLDLWQWMCGMPKRVRAFCYFGKYHTIEVEDDVTAFVEYPNGATGVFITSTADAPGTNRLEVTGDMGKVVVEGENLEFWRLRQNERQFNKEYSGGFGSPECWRCTVPIRDGGSDQHEIIMRNWVGAILRGEELLAPGPDGINGLSISNAMHLSTWTDSWVDLPIDEDLFYERLQQRIKDSLSEKAQKADKAMEVKSTFG